MFLFILLVPWIGAVDGEIATNGETFPEQTYDEQHYDFCRYLYLLHFQVLLFLENSAKLVNALQNVAAAHDV